MPEHGAEILYNNKDFMLIEINDMHLNVDKIKKEITNEKNHYFFKLSGNVISPNSPPSYIVKSFLDSNGTGSALYGDLINIFLVDWKSGKIVQNRADTLDILSKLFGEVYDEMDFLYDGSDLLVFAEDEMVKNESRENIKVVDVNIEYGEKVVKSDSEHYYLYQFDVEKSILSFYKYRLNQELVSRVDFDLNNYFEIYSVNPSFYSFSLDKNIFTFAFNYSKDQEIDPKFAYGGEYEAQKTNIGILNFELNF
jgi:hypothetical protein